MSKLKFITLIVLFALSLSPANIYAQDTPEATPAPSIAEESVNPSDGFKYLIKRVKEKIALKFTFSKKKKEGYMLVLVKRRMAELAKIASENDVSNIEKASQRYFTTAGELTNLLEANPDDDLKKQTLETFSAHTKIHRQLQTNFEDTRAQWRFLKHNIDYLKIYSDKLNE